MTKDNSNTMNETSMERDEKEKTDKKRYRQKNHIDIK